SLINPGDSRQEPARTGLRSNPAFWKKPVPSSCTREPNVHRALHGGSDAYCGPLQAEITDFKHSNIQKFLRLEAHHRLVLTLRR
ncbi:MAG: hypothetical protein ACJAX5_000793, partial [Patiriisocius sp.]